VTNSAGDMAKPKRELARAMYAAGAIVLVVYAAVSLIVVLTLSLAWIEANQVTCSPRPGRRSLGAPASSSSG